MELPTETVSVSFTDKLKFIQYDSPAFRDQPIHEAKCSRSRESGKMSSSKNIATVKNYRNTELREEGNVVLSRYSANEMVNVCYAKIWRGSSNNYEEENDICDDEKVFPSFFEKDLDKLQKLRLKSKSKSRKCLEKGEVKKWVETPEKFINTIKDMRSQNYDKPSLKKTGENSDTPVNADVQLVDDSRNKDASKRNESKVHFPGHVLLRSALQEGEAGEVERIINNYDIDFNSPALTGYNYLHKATENNQLQCARILIQYGIDVNGKDMDGVSPLALAFRLMNFPMVLLLVDSGANLSEYTKCKIEELQRVKELSCSVSKVFEMDV